MRPRREILTSLEFIDESRRISVDAALPNGNEPFSDGIYVPDREEQSPNEEVKKLENSIGPLLVRLGAVEAAVAERDDAAAFQEVTQLRSDLEDVDLSLGSADLSDDPDFANRSLARMRDIRRRLVAIERETGSGAISVTETEKVQERAERTTQVTEKFGTEAEKRESAQLKRKLEQALSRDDQRGARKAGEDLDALGCRVRSNQDRYWKNTFEAQQRAGQRFVNQQEARKWLDAGELAVRKGDSVSLREAVKHVGSRFIHDTVLRIREMFGLALEKAPSVLFIDEFDAFAPSRSELGGHQQYKSEEVNEFLANLEGCADRKVLVIAATNLPEKIDPAVRRPGRFDKLVFIPPPDSEARLAMLQFHLRVRPIEPDLDIRGVAAVLDGYSASDIKMLVEESARAACEMAVPISILILLDALRRVPPSITQEDEGRFPTFQSRGI